MILTIIGAILIFSVIIFVHELGHFLAARLFGVTVHEFAVGMGPVIFKKQGRETLYSIRAIPMGGFCKMEGEDEESEDKGAFSNKKPLPRIIILVAGAGMNILLGFLIAVSIVLATAIPNGGIASTVIDTVNPEASAAEFLEPGDKVIGINGKRVNIKRDLSFELSQAGMQECTITYRRGGETFTDSFMPMEVSYPDGQKGYIIGFNVAMNPVNPWTVLKESFFQTIWMVKLVFISLGMLFTGQAGVSELSGPVGVVYAMNTMAQSGIYDFLFFTSFLAVNIGIMNLLPLPALDGGRVFFILIELIFRRPIPVEKEGLVHFIGFVLLMLLMLYATWNDIVRIFTGGLSG